MTNFIRPLFAYRLTFGGVTPTIQRRRVMMAEIQERVCDFYGIRKADLISARRAREIVHPRQVAMYLAKHLTPWSLPAIGRRFGGRDHSTVHHAIHKIEAMRKTDPVLARDVEYLMGEMS